MPLASLVLEMLTSKCNKNVLEAIFVKMLHIRNIHNSETIKATKLCSSMLPQLMKPFLQTDQWKAPSNSCNTYLLFWNKTTLIRLKDRHYRSAALRKSGYSFWDCEGETLTRTRGKMDPILKQKYEIPIANKSPEMSAGHSLRFLQQSWEDRTFFSLLFSLV